MTYLRLLLSVFGLESKIVESNTTRDMLDAQEIGSMEWLLVTVNDENILISAKTYGDHAWKYEKTPSEEAMAEIRKDPWSSWNSDRCIAM